MFRIIKIPEKKFISAEVTAGIIAGAASLAGTGASIGATSKLNKKNREWQEKMYNQQVSNNREDAATAYERQLSLIQLQGETEQIKRMKLAGLNPALMYDNGPASMSGGSAPTSSPASVPVVSGQNLPDFSGIGSAGAALSSIPKVSAEIRNLNQNTQTQFNQAMAFAASARLSDQQQMNLAFELGLAKDKREYDLRVAAANASIAENTLNRGVFDLETVRIMQPILQRTQELTNQRLEIGIRLDSLDEQLKTADLGLKAKELEIISAKLKNMGAEFKLLVEQQLDLQRKGVIYAAQRDYLNESAYLQTSQRALKDYELTYKQTYEEIDRKIIKEAHDAGIKLSETQRKTIIANCVADSFSKYGNTIIRGGAAIATGGLSEGIFGKIGNKPANPVLNEFSYWLP